MLADEVPPTIQAFLAPSPNESDWHASDVTVTFTCADAESGIENCPGTVTLDDEGSSQELVEEAKDGELFLYPGSGHLFADPSGPDFDEGAATLLKERTLEFLDRVG